jgi:hypothetical protein
MKIDITKKYKTRDGKEVRLLSDQGVGGYPIIGIVGDSNESWTLEGKQFKQSDDPEDLDLVEVKEPRVIEFWMNCYKDGMLGVVYSTEETANLLHNTNRNRLTGKPIHFRKEVEE